MNEFVVKTLRKHIQSIHNKIKDRKRCLRNSETMPRMYEHQIRVRERAATARRDITWMELLLNDLREVLAHSEIGRERLIHDREREELRR